MNSRCYYLTSRREYGQAHARPVISTRRSHGALSMRAGRRPARRSRLRSSNMPRQQSDDLVAVRCSAVPARRQRQSLWRERSQHSPNMPIRNSAMASRVDFGMGGGTSRAPVPRDRAHTVQRTHSMWNVLTAARDHLRASRVRIQIEQPMVADVFRLEREYRTEFDGRALPCSPNFDDRTRRVEVALDPEGDYQTAIEAHDTKAPRRARWRPTSRLATRIRTPQPPQCAAARRIEVVTEVRALPPASFRAARGSIGDAGERAWSDP